jgi:hypothetical protein
MAEQYKPKLKIGNVIRVIGWIMLKGLDDGQYKIVDLKYHFGHICYCFARKCGKKIIAIHFAADVDILIQSNNYNRIEVC